MDYFSSKNKEVKEEDKQEEFKDELNN